MAIVLGVVVMSLTLLVIYNPFGDFALPSIVIGAGTIVALVILVVAFSAQR